MASATTVEIKLSLSSNVYRRSASVSELPSIIATTTVIAPSTLTVALRGEFDSGTILEPDFRAEHFEFYDLTISVPVTQSPFPDLFEEPSGEESRVSLKDVLPYKRATDNANSSSSTCPAYDLAEVSSHVGTESFRMTEGGFGGGFVSATCKLGT
ncbi:hypothetical protein LTR37_020646 [Vermiconidia calcicola]|uniref:Uncharacterized protein n=1 Tax=Vermiconidia calcicola TaxID=1690605 RepID=A0ACC3MAR6_9PEZI|nr:hypothetical protein LTR37_020646 [Vermiconidia calcicola]